MMDSGKEKPCERAERGQGADASNETKAAQTCRIGRRRGYKLVQVSEVLEVANVGNRITSVSKQKLDAIPEHIRRYAQSDGKEEQWVAICRERSHRLTRHKISDGGRERAWLPVECGSHRKLERGAASGSLHRLDDM